MNAKRNIPIRLVFLFVILSLLSACGTLQIDTEATAPQTEPPAAATTVMIESTPARVAEEAAAVTTVVVIAAAVNMEDETARATDFALWGMIFVIDQNAAKQVFVFEEKEKPYFMGYPE